MTAGDRAERRGHVRSLLAGRPFTRLLATRLAGQFGDGVFQASLAGAVLFNPERAAHASDIAAGFAVILLPYSLVGPFAGVLLDRWWRQRVLVRANLLRCLGVLGVAAEVAAGIDGEWFYLSALVVISVNRFFLSGLSAGLPHVARPAHLVTANALSTTFGGIATTVGGAAAIGVRAGVGDSNTAYALIATAAVVPYLLSAFAAHGFARADLGPDDAERGRRETVADVVHGLAAGARHVASRRPAFYALCAIGVQRFLFGVTTICTLLLYRNRFHDEGVFRAGLAGLGQVVVAVAVGSALAALVTPVAVRTLGFVRWPVLLLTVAGCAEIGLGLPFAMPMLLLAAFVLGVAAQGVKIAVDTLIQQTIADDFRGRVFSLYDTLFNVSFVAAATVTAMALPADGYSPTAVIVVGAGYLLVAAAYLRMAASLRPAPVRAASTAA